MAPTTRAKKKGEGGAKLLSLLPAPTASARSAVPGPKGRLASASSSSSQSRRAKNPDTRNGDYCCQDEEVRDGGEKDDGSGSSRSADNGDAVTQRTRGANRAERSTIAACGGSAKSLKPRKATHVIQREEKDELVKQLEKLQAELIGLKYRAMFPPARGEKRIQNDHFDGFTGDVLRDAIKIQQLSLAGVQAVLSDYVSHHKVSPIQTPIRLSKDIAARHLTLQRLKAVKLAEGRRFLAERSRGMDMTKLFSEEERFETDDGGFCVLRFDITPLPGARSVKELFDALFYFIFNVEINVSETLGIITVREDDESGDKTIAHHRLVATTEDGVQVEFRTVHFSDFNEHDSDGDLGSGMIVADFVDDDELHPYRPSERLRNDVTAVVSITPERRRKVKRKADESGCEEEEEDELVITVTRWSRAKLHRPEFAIPAGIQSEMPDRVGRWFAEMLTILRQKCADSTVRRMLSQVEDTRTSAAPHCGILENTAREHKQACLLLLAHSLSLFVRPTNSLRCAHNRGSYLHLFRREGVHESHCVALAVQGSKHPSSDRPTRMIDPLTPSPFMIPSQLACSVNSIPSLAGETSPGMLLGATELEPAFCSPPQQSFRLLLHGDDGDDGDEYPVMKDEFALPPPRRSVVVPVQQPPSISTKPAKTAKRNQSSPSVKSVLQHQKKRPKRKASYLARKEEKEALLKHLDELQGQLSTLKYQAVVHGNFRAQTQARKRLTKNILTDAIQKHQLAVAGLQAMLSKYSSLQEHSPIETTIRLGTELPDRRDTLFQLKDHKILEAKHFIAERSRGLDLTKVYMEEERFETPNGDYCSLRFDIIPIRGAANVKSVFDVMLFYIGNIEITLSETMGHITIREDDDSSDKNISHHRLVTSMGDGIQTESNTVLFSEYTESEQGGFGVIAGDFIDEDELYPYRPLERVRRDVSVMLTVTSYLQETKVHPESAEAATDELIVVLKRWSLGKMHKSDLPIPATALQDIRDNYGRWSDEMLKVVRQNLANPCVHTTTSHSVLDIAGCHSQQ